jgi:hypothetical protein
MSIAEALKYEQHVDAVVRSINHVTSNGIWDPNKLANPPVQTITTTGTGIGDYPTHWYEPVYPSVTVDPVVVPFSQPDILRINWPPPVVNVPATPASNLTFEQILALVKALQDGAFNGAKLEEVKEEEPAAPVEKKYVRVLEP